MISRSLESRAIKRIGNEHGRKLECLHFLRELKEQHI